MHYIVIGFSPTLFVDRGQSLGLVSILIVIGRLGSIPGKIVFGTVFDRRGGLWATRAILGTTAILGVPLIVAPPAIGVWLLPAFVALSASVFPIANALLVAALPPRSSWGIGTFRAVLLAASAVLAAVAGVLLHVVALPVVMVGALVVPAAIAVWIDSLDRRERNSSAAADLA
jgi:MFS family permease